MAPPSVAEHIYESLRNATSDVAEYVADVRSVGLEYLQGIKSLVIGPRISSERVEPCPENDQLQEFKVVCEDEKWNVTYDPAVREGATVAVAQSESKIFIPVSTKVAALNENDSGSSVDFVLDESDSNEILYDEAESGDILYFESGSEDALLGVSGSREYAPDFPNISEHDEADSEKGSLDVTFSRDNAPPVLLNILEPDESDFEEVLPDEAASRENPPGLSYFLEDDDSLRGVLLDEAVCEEDGSGENPPGLSNILDDDDSLRGVLLDQTVGEEVTSSSKPVSTVQEPAEEKGGSFYSLSENYKNSESKFTPTLSRSPLSNIPYSSHELGFNRITPSYLPASAQSASKGPPTDYISSEQSAPSSPFYQYDSLSSNSTGKRLPPMPKSTDCGEPSPPDFWPVLPPALPVSQSSPPPENPPPPENNQQFSHPEQASEQPEVDGENSVSSCTDDGKFQMHAKITTTLKIPSDPTKVPSCPCPATDKALSGPPSASASGQQISSPSSQFPPQQFLGPSSGQPQFPAFGAGQSSHPGGDQPYGPPTGAPFINSVGSPPSNLIFGSMFAPSFGSPNAPLGPNQQFGPSGQPSNQALGPSGPPPNATFGFSGPPQGPPIGQSGPQYGPAVGQSGFQYGPAIGQSGPPQGPAIGQSGFPYGQSIDPSGSPTGLGFGPSGPFSQAFEPRTKKPSGKKKPKGESSPIRLGTPSRHEPKTICEGKVLLKTIPATCEPQKPAKSKGRAGKSKQRKHQQQQQQNQQPQQPQMQQQQFQQHYQQLQQPPPQQFGPPSFGPPMGPPPTQYGAPPPYSSLPPGPSVSILPYKQQEEPDTPPAAEPPPKEPEEPPCISVQCPMPKVPICCAQVATNAAATCPPMTRSTVLGALRSPGGNFIRIGGLSGFIAVAMGAYAAHVFYEAETENEGCEDDAHKKEVFNIANRYHFIHSLALLATPLFRCPLFTGTLLTLGIIVFCGSCYVHALTGNQEIRRATPYGGVLLIAAWLSMML